MQQIRACLENIWDISILKSGIAVDARISRDIGISYFRDLRQNSGLNALQLRTKIDFYQ